MNRLEALDTWLARISGPDWFWLAKRLSANDTGLTGGHQVGIFIPKEFAISVFPQLALLDLNPRVALRFTLVSHDQEATPNLIYYNNRLLGAGTRNETRITGFGGRNSALQDPESTASPLLVALKHSANGGEAEAWLAGDLQEDDRIETAVGPLVPGVAVIRVPGPEGRVALQERLPLSACDCSPAVGDLPAGWSAAYPRGEDLTAEAVKRCSCEGESADARILKRYGCEYELFRVVETAIELPLIGSFRTVGEFTGRALSVLNRRKSRAGNSLELHLARIFDEEGVTYSSRPVTEDRNRPDFIFPSIDAYRQAAPADGRLLMLAVKTSLKDRWRQILPEAEKIPRKHLFTLDMGISEDQVDQITAAGVSLVVPEGRISSYPEPARKHLMTLAAFVRLAS